LLNIKANSRELFNNILIKLKSQLPVMIYDRTRKRYKASIFYLDELKNICEKYGIDLYCSQGTLKYKKDFDRKFSNIRNVKNSKKFKSIFWTDNKKCQLYPDQVKAVNILFNTLGCKLGGFAIGDDMGVGKTAESLAVMCKLFENGYEQTLIVVPNRLKYQWKDEILKFTKFKEKDISVVDGNNLKCILNKIDKPDFRKPLCKKCSRCDECKNLKTNPNLLRNLQINSGIIIIINYEILDKHKKELKKEQFDIIIIDEATRIKNFNSIRTKAFFEIRKALPAHCLIFPMSGTFIENRLEEIYNPYTLINPKIFGEHYCFKNHYLLYDYYNSVIGYKNKKSLKKIIRSWMVRRTIESVWKDRPKLTEITRVCVMNEKHRKFYEDIKTAKMAELHDLELQDKLNTASIGALLMYLIQICDSTETIDPNLKLSCKIDYLKELVTEEISRKKKIVIFSFFANKVIPIIKRELNALNCGKVLSIVGGVSLDKAEIIKQKFLTKKDYRFLVCSDSMSYGANLQAAEYVINFDLLWNPATLDQRMKRVYRRGQKNNVTVINLVTENTIEDRIMEVLGSKRELFSYFIGYGSKKIVKPTLKTLLSILKAN